MNSYEIALHAPHSGDDDFELVDRCFNAILEMDITAGERRLLSFLVGREDDATGEENQAQDLNAEVSNEA